MQYNQAYEIRPLLEGVWSIEMHMVRAFLIAGKVSALLVDTGAGGVNLHAAVCECTALPVRVANTHAHFDHISGNGSFEMQFAHPLELGALAKAGFKTRPISDGSGFDLGGHILQVIDLPGHSPGSIGLWDSERGLLFAGDTVAKGRPVLLCLDGASIEAYVRTMDRILALEDDENGVKPQRIFCAHGDMEADLATVQKLKMLAEQVLAGVALKEPLPERYATFINAQAGMYRYEDVSVLAV